MSKIVKLTSRSDKKLKDLVVKLFSLQMNAIGDKKSKSDIQAALDISLRKNSNSHTLVVLDEEKPIGLCFFNICTGIQSGGKYIWINEIFVVKEHRKAGIAKEMIDVLEKFAAKNKCVYILAQRDIGNLLSAKLFESVGFEQSKVIWISKKV